MPDGYPKPGRRWRGGGASRLSKRKPGAHVCVPEKVEQAHTIELLERIGGKVYTIGTRRSRGKPCPKCGEFVPEHQGTRQTEGLPDLLAFLPSRRPHGEAPRRVLLFVEQKRERGEMSDPQIEFRNLCHDAEVAHVVGTFNAVIAWLCDRGYVKAEQFPHYRQPAGAAR